MVIPWDRGKGGGMESTMGVQERNGCEQVDDVDGKMEMWRAE